MVKKGVEFPPYAYSPASYGFFGYFEGSCCRGCRCRGIIVIDVSALTDIALCLGLIISVNTPGLTACVACHAKAGILKDVV